VTAWGQIVHFLHGLQALSATSPWSAAGLYILIYAVLVACCVPLGPAMSLSGGVLLGFVAGTACALVAITLGCVTCFLIARTAFGATMGERRGRLLGPIRPRLERDGFSALLALRIAPVAPSWLLNLGAAMAGMRLVPFACATVIGVLPATAIFCSAGAGLGGALSETAPPGVGLLLRPEVLLPLLGLSLLALVPMLLRQLRRRHT
jgi:uncharacterized membrane protein YdjX (TVP38/TMEM64 family)